MCLNVGRAAIWIPVTSYSLRPIEPTFLVENRFHIDLLDLAVGFSDLLLVLIRWIGIHLVVVGLINYGVDNRRHLYF